MGLRFEREFEDIRGKSYLFSYEDKQIVIAETKKGYARGGHYYTNEQVRFLLLGKAEYLEEDAKTGSNQKVIILDAPQTILIPPYGAHILVALTDSIVLEILDKKPGRVNYPKLRKIVEEKMNK